MKNKKDKKETAVNIDSLIVGYVTDYKKHFQQKRNKFEGLEGGYGWKQFKEAYEARNDLSQDGASFTVPVIASHVERIVPKETRQIFQGDDYFLVRPALENDEILKEDAKNIQKLIKRQFELIDLEARYPRLSRYKGIYGTVIVKTFWNKKTKTIRTRDKKTGKKIKKTVVLKNCPDFVVKDLRDIWFDPRDENLTGVVIDKTIVNYENLRKVKAYNQSKVKQLKKTKVEKPSEQSTDEKDKGKNVSENSYSSKERKIQVLEFWGMFPKGFLTKDANDIETQERVYGVITLAGIDGDSADLKVLRVAENPFDHQESPYIKCRYLAKEGEAYGNGICHGAMGLHMEINTNRRQLTDMKTKMLRPTWLVDREAEVYHEQLLAAQNRIIETSIMEGVKDLTPPDFTQAALNVDQVSKMDVEDITGASKLIAGQPGGHSLERSAAGISQIMGSALDKFQLVARTAEEEFFKPLIRKFYQLNQQFAPPELIQKLTGTQIIQLPPEEVFNTYHIEFGGIQDVVNKDAKANLIINAMQAFPQWLIPVIKPPVIAKQIFKYLGFKDAQIKEAINDPESKLEDTPEGEHQILMTGKKPKVDVEEDFEDHLEKHYRFLESPQFEQSAQFIKKLLLDHIEDTHFIKNTIMGEELNPLERETNEVPNEQIQNSPQTE